MEQHIKLKWKTGSLPQSSQVRVLEEQKTIRGGCHPACFFPKFVFLMQTASHH